MIRQFYLENEYGQRWDLNNPATGLLISPEGLGYSMESSYVSIGHSFIRNYFKESQQAVTGTVVFGSAAPYVACI